MTKSRDLPTPRRFAEELEELQRLARRTPELLKGYELAYSYLDPRGGSEGVHVLSGTSNYVPEAAIESKRVEAYLNVCRRLFKRVEEASQDLGNALSDVRGGIMGETFSQIAKASRDSVLRAGELEESIAAKSRRDERGEGIVA